MNVVDSSAWLEYFADGPNASFFAEPIEDTEGLVVPTLTRISHHPTVEARDTSTRTSLRLLAVLDVLFKYACARQAARASS